jgi:hypothetical protein
MIIDLKKIIEIKTIDDIKKYKINEPIFHNNYLFHYLIIFNKLDILKLIRFPIYKENEEGLNGLCLAARYNIKILKYLLNAYPEYIYNTNEHDETFIDFLDYKQIIEMLNLDLKWDLLLKNKIDILLYNLRYDDLLELFKKINLDGHSLNMIIINKNLSTDQIIKILELFNQNLNLRNKDDETIIFQAIHKKDIKLLKYLLTKNIDIDYYTVFTTYHPLKTAINNNYLPIIELIWNKIKNTFNYTLTNRNLETIAHFLLKRIDGNFPFDKITLEILNNCPSSVWAAKDIHKITPLELLTHLDVKYSYLLKNKAIKIDFKIKNNNWKLFLKSLPKYKEKDNIILNDYTYSHSNLYQARFKDMSFYLLHLS